MSGAGTAHSAARNSRFYGKAVKDGHARGSSWPSPPLPSSFAQDDLTRSSSDIGLDGSYPKDRVTLILQSYKVTATISSTAQPSPLPSTSTHHQASPSNVLFSHAALPWPVRAGDYLEVRRVRRTDVRSTARGRTPGAEAKRSAGEALKGIQKGLRTRWLRLPYWCRCAERASGYNTDSGFRGDGFQSVESWGSRGHTGESKLILRLCVAARSVLCIHRLC